MPTSLFLLMFLPDFLAGAADAGQCKDGVHRGNEQQGHQRRHGQTADNGNTHRAPHLATDTSADSLNALFSRYDINFIVQEKARQHPELQRVNPTSLNSMRLYTYRTLEGKCEFLYPYSMLRFGGKGAVKDNTSKGGGTCLIDRDGHVDDRVFRFKHMEISSLKRETGVENLVVPCYHKVIDTLLAMHSKLPYFDYVGWDVTVDPDGEPLFIEFNLVPAIEGPQLMAGPMFAEHLDEVVERARQGQCSKVQTNKKVYPKGSVFYLHAR